MVWVYNKIWFTDERMGKMADLSLQRVWTGHCIKKETEEDEEEEGCGGGGVVRKHFTHARTHT